jgi:nicotinamidase/pyrazinamidase
LNAPYFWRPDELGFRTDSPRTDEAREEGLRAREYIHPGKKRSALLPVDFLIDFVYKNGKLSVQGGIEAIRNFINLIYERAEDWEVIIILRDWHEPFDITDAAWWINEKTYLHPAALSEIFLADLKGKNGEGCWMPLFEPAWSKLYLTELAKTNQPPLKIWWSHCVKETMGANMPPELVEAITWLRAARGTKVITLLKGTNPLTDHFGFLPCVPVPGDPLNAYYESILDYVMDLRGQDIDVYGAGLAENICLHRTFSQTITAGKERKQPLDNFFLLSDCTSPVDEKDRGKHFAKYEAAGIRIVKSTSI